MFIEHKYHIWEFCLAFVAGAVIQATGRTELEDGTRTGVQLLRLHAHCGVCTSPTVMLNPLLGDGMVLGVVQEP